MKIFILVILNLVLIGIIVFYINFRNGDWDKNIQDLYQTIKARSNDDPIDVINSVFIHEIGVLIILILLTILI